MNRGHMAGPVRDDVNDDASDAARAEERHASAALGQRGKKGPSLKRWFARTCRWAGLKVMRGWRYSLRRARRLGRWAFALLRDLQGGAARSLRVFCARNGISFAATASYLSAIRDGSRRAAERGVGQHVLYWAAAVCATVLRAFARVFGSINYVAPLLASAAFATVVYFTLNLTFALEVNYNGEFVGYIADESVFERAESQMKGRIVFEDYIRPTDNIPQFSLAVIKPEQLIDKDLLTNELIQASGNEITEASGLYVDERFMGAVPSQDQLDSLLNSIKAKFSTGEPGEEVEFIKPVEIRSGLYPVTSIVDVRMLERELNSEESQQRIYTTVAGDAPTIIAQKNNISYSQLKALNPGIEKSLLIGQEILVEKAVPMLEVKVSRTVTYEEEIPFKVEQVQDTSQYQGYVQVSQNGVKGATAITARVTYVDGIETAREVIDTRVIREAVNEKVVVGGKRPLEQVPSTARTTSTNFIWPADGGYVTCAYAGYVGHTGMDIGGMPQGTAIRAAAAGTVTAVKYNTTGYGYHIMISHGGGVQTLYGHNSKLYVQVGDWVEQGQLIAAMGRTGRATGVHVHFEIRVNGKYMNPANYIGTRYPY